MDSPTQCIKSPAANACIFKRIEGSSNALVWTFFHLSEMDAFSRSEMGFGLHRRLTINSLCRPKEECHAIGCAISRRTVVILRLHNPFLTHDTFPRVSARWNNYARWNPCNCASFKVMPTRWWAKQCLICLDSIRALRNVESRDKNEKRLCPFLVVVIHLAALCAKRLKILCTHCEHGRKVLCILLQSKQSHPCC